MKINSYIDHTLLSPTALPSDINTLCEEALAHSFFSVCVNGCYVKQAADIVADSNVKVCTVIGFPLGAMSGKAKVLETEQALKDGAQEFDVVINLGWLKAGEYNKALQELAFVKDVVGKRILKVIIETCYLTDKEKEDACKLVVDSGADFVKTSTGFGTHGATLDDVKLMKNVVKNNIQIKASGGIKSYATALEYIALGVSRIGTSSGVKIISEALEH